MPRRDDLHTILLLGSGPIVIGQAGEFDYSGTQAATALRDEGYRVVLVNSNPATIMTDPSVADRTYVEPLDAEAVEEVIAIERPDALLPTLGGQTALNLAMELAASGVLERYGVELIGADVEAIRRAEDREAFRDTMAAAGLAVPDSRVVTDLESGRAAARELGLPVILRPGFTLGGEGGGAAHTPEELEERLRSALDASPIGQVLVERSVLGWAEIELEVVRDSADNAVVICSIENLDPMGVHTGDSVTVAPVMTLSDPELQTLRDASIAVIRAVGVATGGANVQFALDRETGEMVVIEMNPRVSRSSALASKATGFPIAKVAARLAVGYTLDELPNEITGVTPASFEPTLDYVAVKVPRFAFEKLPGADTELTTHMKSVGEVLALGRTFGQAFGKAMAGRELDVSPRTPAGVDEALDPAAHALVGPLRPDPVGARARRADVARLHEATGVDPWFLGELAALAEARAAVRGPLDALDAAALRTARRAGLSDRDLADATGSDEAGVWARRRALGVRPTLHAVDTCGAEFAALTPYYYSAFESESELARDDRPAIVVLGSGPNRIGQGIEFDYCCVHAALTARELGYAAVMVNCNPETVSTDHGVSDRLYLEPVTIGSVLDICAAERPVGVVTQLGGQTPLRLARGLAAEGVPVLGTPPESIDLAEDRGRFGRLLSELGLEAPPWAVAHGARGGARRRGRGGLPGAGAAVLRARRPRHGHLRLARGPARLHRPRGGGRRAAGRPLPGERHRVRRQRALRRHRLLDRRGDGARRGGGRPLRRLGVRAPSPGRGPGPRGRARGADGGPRQGPRRGGPGERAVRRARGARLRDRGQPPGVAHRALRGEGHRRPPGAPRRAGDAGHPSRRARAAGRGPRPARGGEGGGAPVRPVPRSRSGARSGDAGDRRGDGPRRQLRRGVRQGAARRRPGPPAERAPRSSRRATPTSPGRWPSPPASRPPASTWWPRPGPPRRCRRPGSRCVWCARSRRPGRRTWASSSPGGRSLWWSTPPAADRGARTDGYEIRASAIRAGIPCITTIDAAEAAAAAVAARGAGRPEALQDGIQDGAPGSAFRAEARHCLRLNLRERFSENLTFVA